MTSIAHPDALPGGHRVQEFELLSVLGVGGFGITYLAKDTLLDRTVAIKEYFPRDLAVRTEDHSVHPRSQSESESESEDYIWGLKRFRDEAKTLARLNHLSIIRIYKYFEAHGSGYIVMEYVEGETLSERLKHENTLSESQLMAILNPLVEGLEQVHAAGYLHRDITPKNILLRKDGTPVLIDFGAARQAIGARSRSVTAVVTPGYAPLEQYSTRGRQQGPWTDIYGLSAVAYRCIAGTTPKDATERAQGESLTSASELAEGQYAKGLLTAIDRGLSIKAEDRPQDLKAWCSLWEQKEKQQATAAEVGKQEESNRAIWKNKNVLISVVAGIVVLLVIGLYTFQAEQKVEELKLAAEQGDAGAQYNLGQMYEEGRGVPQNDAEAVKWYRIAAEQGNAGAQYMLGERYSNVGRGVTQDYAEAVKWYRLAAEQGNARAQGNLGQMYREGEGVSQNYAEAVKWYRLAAEQGNARAQARLGQMYEEGHGVPQNDAEAVKWYRIAAEQGNVFAQYMLGEMYSNVGRGVTQDYIEAHKWYNLADSRSDGRASFLGDLRDQIERKMTQEEITTARRLAREWRQKTWDELKTK